MSPRSLLLVALALSASPAALGQVMNPANGHHYDFIPVASPLTWDEAQGLAEAVLIDGVPGHLVTLTSAAEEAFYLSNFGGGQLDFCWLGLYQDLDAPDYSEPAGAWKWVTGEPLTYTNWSPNEPNNSSNAEHWACFDFSNFWNDLREDFGGVNGYCVEWDTVPQTRYCISGPNSSGGAAEITAEGSISVAANGLGLRAAPMPAGQFGVFFYGSEQTQTPFGNGFLCVGPGAAGLARLEVVTADAGGVLQYEVDLQAPPTPATTITPGSTWNFQAWFRDPAAGGANFDLSDAVSITFVP